MSASPDQPPSEAPPKRERRKQARPGELLDAALALFVEKGFAATRVEEVAARAGVSKGTLFLYFPSKEALFKAVVHENAGRILADAFREVAEFNGSSTELLREFLRRWWALYGGTPAAGLTKLMVSEAANFPELAQHYQDEVVDPSHELLRRVVQRGIDRGEFRPVDVPQLVHLIVAPLVQMVTWRYSLAPCCPSAQQIDAPALVELHADLLLRALRADKPAP
ncbi:MAG: TetR/AcrR family transcriptional regulator [Ottowia sp.]|uniref:TetR family transcriptional regulator n=1 Tax=Ottowia sp. TaxID=1898956 RepID=UPI0039E5EA19